MNHSVTHPAPTSPTTRQVNLRAALTVGLAVLAWLAAYMEVDPDGRMIDIGEVACVFARAAKQTGADIFDTQRDARVSGDSRGLAHGFD